MKIDFIVCRSVSLLFLLFSFVSGAFPGSAQEVRKWYDDDKKLIVIGSISEVQGERILIKAAGGGMRGLQKDKISRNDRKYVEAFVAGTLPNNPASASNRGFALQFFEFWEGINGQDLKKGYAEKELAVNSGRSDEVVMIKRPSSRKLVMARIEFRVAKGDEQSVAKLVQRRKQLAKKFPAFTPLIEIDPNLSAKLNPSNYRFLDKDLFEVIDRRGNRYQPIWVARQSCNTIVEVDKEIMQIAGNDTPPATRNVLRTQDSYTGLISTADVTTRMYLLYALPRSLDKEDLDFEIRD